MHPGFSRGTQEKSKQIHPKAITVSTGEVLWIGRNGGMTITSNPSDLKTENALVVDVIVREH